MNSPQYIYHVDKNDVVFYFNQHWIAFAEENQAGQLAKQALGKPIWSFISDGLVKTLYKELMLAVRKSNEKVKISFRCDSPEKMRFMQMEIFPLINGGLAFHNTLLREKLKSDGYSPEILAIIGEAGYPMCSRCNKIAINKKWHELEEALKLKLLENKTLKAHYGMCPTCTNTLKKSIEDLKKRTKI